MTEIAEEEPAVTQIPPRPPSAAVALRPDAARSLPAKIEYARELANSGLLPSVYRRNPANVLYAVEYGDMLGLSAMAAITGIHVIEGKPTASAGLISALVRRAGHKLRVRGDAKSAVCQIIRSDDPSYTFEVTWTLRKNDGGHPSAEEAGLLGKQVWKNYPASMLKSRAITQCARDACEEALYGLHYTAEELGAEVDEEGVVVGEIVPDRPQRQTVQAEDPDGDPWTVRTDEGTAWLAEASGRAATFADLEDGRKLWAETAEKLRDGAIVKADADHLAALMKARNEELTAADAEIVGELDPDDPWAAKVADVATAEEADAVLAELDEVARESGMLAADHARIAAAIEARVAELDAVAAA